MSSTRYQFQKKTILITGGTGDIGQASAHRFASDGASVIILDISKEKLHRTTEELRVHGVPVSAYYCDVTRSAEVRQVVDRAVTEFERIDYLFNNAGYQGAFAKTDEYPDNDFKIVIDVNILGVYNMLKVVAAAYASDGWWCHHKHGEYGGRGRSTQYAGLFSLQSRSYWYN